MSHLFDPRKMDQRQTIVSSLERDLVFGIAQRPRLQSHIASLGPISVSLLNDSNCFAADAMICSEFEFEPVCLSVGKPEGKEGTDGLPYGVRNASLVVKAGDTVIAAAISSKGAFEGEGHDQVKEEKGEEWLDRLHHVLDFVNVKAHGLIVPTGKPLIGTGVALEVKLLATDPRFRGPIPSEDGSCISIIQRLCLGVEELAKLEGFRCLYSHSNDASGPRQGSIGWETIFKLPYSDLPKEWAVSPVEGHIHWMYKN
ncbi:hypothetical protein BCR33DRAFT_716221, partial [Rhizoclosmatium globosum]